MRSLEQMEALFHPRNVVLAGASDRVNHWSKRVWDNLYRFGYEGAVFTVNPRLDALWGERCYPSLADLPEPPDHLAIFTPADVTLELLREAGKAGARSATLYAAGFGEGGSAQGCEAGQQLLNILVATGITATGPACMGVASGEARFCTIPDETLQPFTRGPVALIAQSGAMCGSINRALNELGLTLSYVASCGSQIGCTISDFLEYFAAQPEIRTVLCYIEAIRDVERFLDAARAARKSGRTVVAVKVGGSDEARASALAHTGSLAGRAEIFDAYARAAGIVRVSSLEEGIEAVEFLARTPLPRGNRVSAYTISGAIRSLITEGAGDVGLTLSSFSCETKQKLSALLKQTDVENPLDAKVTRPPAEYTAILETVLDDPHTDILLIADELPDDNGAARKIANLQALEEVSIRAAARGKSLAIFSPLLVGTSNAGRKLRATIASVPLLRTTRGALSVLKALTGAATAPLQAGDFFRSSSGSAIATKWREHAARLDRAAALSEIDSKALLGAYGIPMPRERTVHSAGDALIAAAEIGYPVVIKGVSAAITHKTEAGLVMLNVADAEGVSAGCLELEQRATEAGVKLDDILVSEMVRAGTELVLSAGWDVEMGPFVMIGAGGILVELFQDVAFAPVSLDRDRALALIAETRVNKLLAGFRDRKPADREALADAILNVARLAGDLGDAMEAIEINPLMVLEAGRGLAALDALIVLRPPQHDR